MPLQRYFLGVGGTLFALLFAADAVLPKPSVTGIVSASEKPQIRIHSERKGPEAIVFDTTRPTIVPSTTASAEAAVAEAHVALPEQAVRKSFAQLIPVRPAQAAGYRPRKVSARRSHKRELAAARVRRPQRFTENARVEFFKMTW
jgi:hypothetical protein